MFKKILTRIICCVLALFNFLPNTVVRISPSNRVMADVPFYKKILEYFLPSKQQDNAHLSSGKFVYVSGYPIGFSIDGAGAVVVEKSSVISENGYINPTEGVDIQIGDIIKEINGVPITSGETITKIVNQTENIGSPVELKLNRGDKEIVVKIKAEYDIFASSFRLGLWVRDNAVGVGMITYVTEEGCFGSLGHPITDIDTGSILPVSGGRVYKCSIIGAEVGQKGTPGELKGLFLKNSNTIGSVSENLNSGVYGKLDQSTKDKFCLERLEVSLPEEVQMGNATLISTVDGITPVEYDIEIVKTNYTTSSGNKCMVIRIIDERLIDKTGGIVQGMSGSPIVQNNKLIGCVTHVFISDPKKGFASFAIDMVNH